MTETYSYLNVLFIYSSYFFFLIELLYTKITSYMYLYITAEIFSIEFNFTFLYKQLSFFLMFP